MSAGISTSKTTVALSLDTSAVADELQRVGEALIAAAQQIRGTQPAPPAAPADSDAG